MRNNWDKKTISSEAHTSGVILEFNWILFSRFRSDLSLARLLWRHMERLGVKMPVRSFCIWLNSRNDVTWPPDQIMVSHFKRFTIWGVEKSWGFKIQKLNRSKFLQKESNQTTHLIYAQYKTQIINKHLITNYIHLPKI